MNDLKRKSRKKKAKRRDNQAPQKRGYKTKKGLS
jgi:hypothetical protein